MATQQQLTFMREAIRIQRDAGVVRKSGGAFGALIVKEDAVVASCGNSVIKDLDPSAHAEVNAIRQACRKLGTWDLSGCELYSSCQCCPMCYSTAYWARISRIYYAASWQIYRDLFSDEEISQDMLKPIAQRHIPQEQMLEEEAVQVWEEFRALPDGARY